MDLYYFSTFLRRILNWRLVRGVAELHILTKATYFMLVFVPILAGTWPAVRLYVNNHNEAVIEATEILKSYEKSFEKSKSSLEIYLEKYVKDENLESEKQLDIIIGKIGKEADKFTGDVRSFTDDFIPKTIEEPALPWTWAAAFFASLFAVIAHLMYQLASPEVLRRFTLDEFVKEKKEDYSKHPSEESLQRAQGYLNTKQGLSETDFDRHRAYRAYDKLVNELQEIKRINSPTRPIDIATNLSLTELSSIQNIITQDPELYGNSSDVLKLVRHAYELNSEKVGGSDLEKQKNMTIIERGARAEYLFWAGRNLFSAFLTTFIYSIAIYIIFEIILIQAGNVIQMAGWSDISELFRLNGRL